MQPVSGDAALSYSAQEWRQFSNGALAANEVVANVQGVVEAADLKVTQRGAGANLSVDVAAGQAFVLGDDVTSQGPYFAWNDGTVNVAGITVPGSGTFHHRIVLQVQDKLNNGTWTGYTAALTALLDPGTGLPAEPNSAITLATIDVPSGSGSVVNSMINDYRQQVGPVAKAKTADTARTHATTLTSDPDLQLLNLQVSAIYEVFGVLFYTGGSGAGEGDFAWQFTVGGGAGGSYSDPHLSPAGNFGGFGSSTWTAQHGAQTSGTSSLQDVVIMGCLATGTAPPQTLILQWAQNSDSGTATTLKANSFLRARRVA